MLGRGVVVVDGAPPPAPWSATPVEIVDDAVLDRPGALVERGSTLIPEGRHAMSPIADMW